MISDRDYQINNLQKIYDDALFSPVFKRNPKYPGHDVPRIAYDDVMDFKFVIRNDVNFDSNPFWSENSEVISVYDTLEQIVDDGWRLD